MSNQYETVFIMTPVLSEEQLTECVSKFKKILTDLGAKIVFENNWGLRKLAYPIHKKTTGFYYLVEFTSHTRAVWSQPPVTMRLPSGLKYTHVTVPMCPLSASTSWPFSASHTRAVPS